MLSVLRAATGWLQQRGVEAPRRSAELLLAEVLKLDRLQLYLAHDRPLDAAERAAMRALIARRGTGEPVAYLLGHWNFRGLELVVSDAVLIPRPETEELVDLVLERAPVGAQVLELGTGSGAIALAIAHARPDLRVLATDVSERALAIAAQNARRHGLADRVAFARGSWWDACPAAATFALVVSNPPYVDPDRQDLIDPAVSRFEPAQALYAARGDVISSYRAIAAQLSGRLQPGGWFIAETGAGAAEPAFELLRADPALERQELRRDLQDRPRFLLAQRR